VVKKHFLILISFIVLGVSVVAIALLTLNTPPTNSAATTRTSSISEFVLLGQDPERPYCDVEIHRSVWEDLQRVGIEEWLKACLATNPEDQE
jgi:hypothetical protein